MKVDEYAIGVLAYLLLLGEGTAYPRTIKSTCITDNEIYNNLHNQEE